MADVEKIKGGIGKWGKMGALIEMSLSGLIWTSTTTSFSKNSSLVKTSVSWTYN